MSLYTEPTEVADPTSTSPSPVRLGPLQIGEYNGMRIRSNSKELKIKNGGKVFFKNLYI